MGVCCTKDQERIQPNAPHDPRETNLSTYADELDDVNDMANQMIKSQRRLTFEQRQQ